MQRAGRLIALAAMTLLGGCGPSYLPQELAAVSNARQVNEALARDHKITWAEAARREVAEASRIAGDRLDDPTRLAFSYKIALAAEVDAGRMTPELADYRYSERVAQNQAAEQQRRAEIVGSAFEAAGAGFTAASNSYAQNRPVHCTSSQNGMFTNTTCN